MSTPGLALGLVLPVCYGPLQGACRHQARLAASKPGTAPVRRPTRRTGLHRQAATVRRTLTLGAAHPSVALLPNDTGRWPIRP
jgi:hypothetical protein